MLAPRNSTVAAARLSLAGAVLLVVSLFFSWLTIPLASATGAEATKQSLDGWTVLESGDAVLVFVAFVAFGLVVLRRIDGPWLLLLSAGALAVVVTFMFSTVPITEIYKQVYRSSGYTYDADKGIGIWIAAAGAILLLIAGGIQAQGWMQGLQPGSRRRGTPPKPADDRRAAGGEPVTERESDPTWGWRSRVRR